MSERKKKRATVPARRRPSEPGQHVERSERPVSTLPDWTVGLDSQAVSRPRTGDRRQAVVYLDSPTRPKPQSVIDAMSRFAETGSPRSAACGTARVEATDRFEAPVATAVSSRPECARGDLHQNATESRNLSSTAGGGPTCRAATSWLLTHMEHHANIVRASSRRAAHRAALVAAPRRRTLDLTDLPALLDGAKVFLVHGDEHVLQITPVGQAVPPRRTPPARCDRRRVPVTRRTTSPTCRRWAATSTRSAPQDVRAVGVACCGPARSWLEAMPPFLAAGT